MHCFDAVMKVILQWEWLGSRVLVNGTRLVGHVPHVGPEAYLHAVFGPLDHRGIAQVEAEVGRPLPSDLKALLGCANGMDLFSGSLSLDGLRHSYVRTGDEAWQPFSILLANLDERPRDADDSYVFFGGYNWDRSLLYMQPWSPKVYRCPAATADPLNAWPTLAEMLVSEVSRLSAFFDRRGRKLGEGRPTTP